LTKFTRHLRLHHLLLEFLTCLGVIVLSQCSQLAVISLNEVHCFVETYNSELAALGEVAENDDAETAAARQELQEKAVKAQVAVAAVNEFHDQITKHWTTPSQRVRGYVFHAPPISFSTGPKQFVEDWALIDIYLDKIDWSSFKGNVIYLGMF